MKHAEVLILTCPYLIGGQSVNYAYYEAVDIWFYSHNFIHLTIFSLLYYYSYFYLQINNDQRAD